MGLLSGDWIAHPRMLPVRRALQAVLSLAGSRSQGGGGRKMGMLASLHPIPLGPGAQAARKGAKHRAPRVVLSLAVLSVLAASCVTFGAPSGRLPIVDKDPDEVVIASFDFPESVLLAELYAQALEAHDYPVRRMINLGSRETVDPALFQGHVDLVPEYLGTALAFSTLGKSAGASNKKMMVDWLSTELRSLGVTVTEPAEAQNRNEIVVTKETAERLELVEISDLRDKAERLTFGGPPECPARDLCLVGLERRYGIDFERFLSLDAGGPATLNALLVGEIDVALLFSTNPNIVEHDLVLLEDDRKLQPPENVVPIIRSEVIARYGSGLTNAIEEVTRRLSTSDLRILNRAVELEGRSPAGVATQWLTTQELIE